MVRSLVDGLLGKKLKVNDKIDLIILRYGLIDEMSLDVVLEKFWFFMNLLRLLVRLSELVMSDVLMVVIGE